MIARTVATFTAADGVELKYVATSVEGSETAILYLHGIESHAGWFDSAAPMLAKKGIDVFALDRRGSGLNRGIHGRPDGHALNKEEVLGDIEVLLGELREQYARIVLVGLSWGGKPALTYALRHPSKIDGVVLITPGLKAKIGVPIWTRLKILFQSLLRPTATTRIPIRPEMFTTTHEHLKFIREDSLRLHRATAGFFLVSRAFEIEIDRRIDRLRVPTLVVLAGLDQIIDNEKVQKLLRKARDASVRTIIYDDQTHSIQFDDPKKLTSDIVSWSWGLTERDRQTGP